MHVLLLPRFYEASNKPMTGGDVEVRFVFKLLRITPTESYLSEPSFHGAKMAEYLEGVWSNPMIHSNSLSTPLCHTCCM